MSFVVAPLLSGRAEALLGVFDFINRLGHGRTGVDQEFGGEQNPPLRRDQALKRRMVRAKVIERE